MMLLFLFLRRRLRLYHHRQQQQDRGTKERVIAKLIAVWFASTPTNEAKLCEIQMGEHFDELDDSSMKLRYIF